MSESSLEAISASTRYCALYGAPVRHSASPAMHNAALQQLGLNWRYLAFEVAPAHLRAALEGARRMGFIGLNLTVPHKLLALEMMDVLDESARTWGAVNTVRFEGRDEQGNWRPLAELEGFSPEVRMHGFNTDADGLARALREDLSVQLPGAVVLLLGAGGAAQAAALKLAAEGVRQLFLVNRTLSRAEALAREVLARFPRVQVRVGYPTGTVDLVVNATSLGLKPGDGVPLERSHFDLKQAAAVYDLVYRPAETALLREARLTGCRTANGLGMLLYQGARALELWTGRPAPVEVMRSALTKNVYA